MKNSMTLTSLLELLEPGESMTFYVMPTVHVKSDRLEYIDELLLTYVKNELIHFVTVAEGELGDNSRFRPGNRLTLGFNKDGFRTGKEPTKWKTACTYNGTKFCYGQSILISAPPNSGKTSSLLSLLDAYEDNNRNVVSYRLLVGERYDDSLYKRDQLDKTIHCDSSAPIKVQMHLIYETLTKALDSAYSGKNSILAIDSLTRMILGLTGLHSKSHMLSGGLSFDVTLMVSNLFKLAGTYCNGTLTIVGSCFYEKSSNTWKQVYNELAASANAELVVARPDQSKPPIVVTSNRREEVIIYPHINILGWKIYY